MPLCFIVFRHYIYIYIHTNALIAPSFSFSHVQSNALQFNAIRCNSMRCKYNKVLVGLYEEPERPVNAIEYIKRYLGASSSNNNSGKNSNNNNMSDGLSNSIKKENEELKAKVEKLTRALEEAKDK
mmetsp:Transcript_18111/g.27621  ORF Transcript_18111/g.27621 Transcript_18111/m.27621 type:complete len:126 (+) Transcript_18111:289-666(+)